MTTIAAARRPAHLRVIETLIDRSGAVVAECVVREYRTRKSADERVAAARLRASANLRTYPDWRHRAVYRVERIPLDQRG